MITQSPTLDWPELDLLDAMPTIEDINAMAVAQLPALALPYQPTVESDPSELYAHRACVKDETGLVCFRGAAYYDPRAAWDAAVAYARHYDRIKAKDRVYHNYYLKVRDGGWSGISGICPPEDAPQTSRGWLFLECRMNIDTSWKWEDCIFISCTPHNNTDHPTMVNCTVDGPIFPE